ncbi:hypothetical protein KAS42_04210 [bacterium]|nr:hypothetical protein [bacterium]
MISKSQLNKILFIQKHIVEKELFTSDLFKKLNFFFCNKINTSQFNNWLNSWEATAELDQDPGTSERIKKALKEIKSKRTPHKSWKEFKHSLGIQ